MSKVRLAIIGADGISHEHAKGVLQHQDKIECVALCDVSEANLDARAKQLSGAPRRFNDWKTMLAEMGSGLDAVDICMVYSRHTPLADGSLGRVSRCHKPSTGNASFPPDKRRRHRRSVSPPVRLECAPATRQIGGCCLTVHAAS